jgi:hypothetical protein
VNRVLVGTRPLRRPRRKWEDGISMDLWEICWGVVWSGFSWVRMETGDELSGSGVTDLVTLLVRPRMR